MLENVAGSFSRPERRWEWLLQYLLSAIGSSGFTGLACLQLGLFLLLATSVLCITMHSDAEIERTECQPHSANALAAVGNELVTAPRLSREAFYPWPVSSPGSPF